MDIVNAIIIALHLLGLVIAMGSSVALPLVMSRIASAGEGERDKLFGVGSGLMRNANIGLGLLWVTGILSVVLKYGGIDGLDFWFWTKIVLVVVLSASIGMGSAAFRRFKAGDKAAGERVAMIGKINLITGALIILTAVLAFG